MACSDDFIQYIVEQCADAGEISARKMMGDLFFLSLLLWLGGVRTKFENIARLAIERTANGIERGKAYRSHLARFELRKIHNRNINALRKLLQRHLASREHNI